MLYRLAGHCRYKTRQSCQHWKLAHIVFSKVLGFCCYCCCGFDLFSKFLILRTCATHKCHIFLCSVTSFMSAHVRQRCLRTVQRSAGFITWSPPHGPPILPLGHHFKQLHHALLRLCQQFSEHPQHISKFLPPLPAYIILLIHCMEHTTNIITRLKEVY